MVAVKMTTRTSSPVVRPTVHLVLGARFAVKQILGCPVISPSIAQGALHSVLVTKVVLLLRRTFTSTLRIIRTIIKKIRLLQYI